MHKALLKITHKVRTNCTMNARTHHTPIGEVCEHVQRVQCAGRGAK